MLCQAQPDLLYVSVFASTPICLRSVYFKLPEELKSPHFALMPINYPDLATMDRIVERYGPVPGERARHNRGLLFKQDANGRLSVVAGY